MAVMMGKAQDELYLYGTMVNGVLYTGDNRITEFNGTDSYKLIIKGGSGSGTVTYSVQCITGSGTIDSSGAFSFLTPGRVWVKVQKAQSGNYDSSKILIVELTLKRKKVTVSVVNPEYRNVGEEVGTLNQNNYSISPSGSASRPTIYFVYDAANVYEGKERYDKYHEGAYPIAATGSAVVDSNKYDPNIQYRSNKLIYRNTKKYYIYGQKLGEYADLGSIETIYPNPAKPYDKVQFHIDTQMGAYFLESEIQVWASIRNQSTYLSFTQVEGTLVPEEADVGHIRSCSYQFEVPINLTSSIVIYAQFHTTGSITSGEAAWTNPYVDVTASNIGANRLEAVKFCYWARSKYFNEEDPLMDGFIHPGNRRRYFYRPDGDLPTNKYMLRGDISQVFHRLSHSLPFSYTESIPGWEFPYSVMTDPDKSFQMHSSGVNAPQARLYYYANYNYGVNRAGYTLPSGVFNESDESVNNAYIHVWGMKVARDDYIGAYEYLSDIAWSSWTSSFNGYDEYKFGPNSSVTFQDAAAALWRFARFRQIDVRGDAAYMNIYTSDSEVRAASPYAVGPLAWTKRYNISTWYNPDGSRLTPQSYLDRAEFAYMVMRFCQLYSW